MPRQVPRSQGHPERGPDQSDELQDPISVQAREEPEHLPVAGQDSFGNDEGREEDLGGE